MSGAGYVVICLFIGLAGGVVAKIKGNSFWIWFLIAAVVPFGIGLLASILQRADGAEDRRACPGCGRTVMIHDALCTRCGTELEFPEDPDEIVAGPLAAG